MRRPLGAWAVVGATTVRACRGREVARHRVVVVALGCIVLMLDTVVGFILADTVRIFGFKLPAVTGWAYESLIAELLSAVVLAVLVVRSWRAVSAAPPASVTQGIVGSG